MDDVAGERRRKGGAFPPPPSPSSASLPALTPRGPGLPLSHSPSSPSGSSFLPSPPPPDAASVVLSLPAHQAYVSGSPAAASTLPAGAMDGGSGEALLLRRSKPKKRPPPPPAEPHAARREFGAGDRALMLWRDYHDLRQETEAKKRRLESKNRKKLRLLAEVKFLRRKYDFLVKCNSQQRNYKLKGQARQIQSPVEVDEASALPEHAAGPSTSKNTSLELNQDSVMNNDGSDRRGHQGHPGPGNLDQDGVDEDTATADVKFSVCSKDTKNSPSCEDKRKISWQDHLALQV